MKSHRIAIDLLHYSLWGKGQAFACTEVTYGDHICDVLTVNKEYLTSDYEIKTNGVDLKRELRCIKRVVESLNNKESQEEIKNKTKFHLRRQDHAGKLIKHRNNIYRWKKLEISKYCWNSGTYQLIACEPQYVPSMFYFVVVEELVNLAKEGCKNTPYGIIKARKRNCGDFKFTSIKKVQKIHSTEISKSVLLKFAQHQSYRLLNAKLGNNILQNMAT